MNTTIEGGANRFGELTETPSSEQALQAPPFSLFPTNMLPMVLAMVDSTIFVTAPPTVAAGQGDGRLYCGFDERCPGFAGAWMTISVGGN